jgi:hypothetical protein
MTDIVATRQEEAICWVMLSSVEPRATWAEGIRRGRGDLGQAEHAHDDQRDPDGHDPALEDPEADEHVDARPRSHTAPIRR